MRVSRRLETLERPSAVAIGNFDGFHAGHRQICEILQATAQRQRLAAVVLTFQPHPRLFFRHAIQLISTDRQRLEMLKGLPLDRLFFVDFASVVSCPARDFVRDVLIDRLRMQFMVVGEDFRLGREREGDLAYLRRLAAAERFAIVEAPGVEIDGCRVTSSRIRKKLAAGDIRAANRMLEKPYCIDGIVEKGAGRGRKLGFPTMNIASENDILPGGVFHTELELAALLPGERNARLPSATFIGRAPTFTDPGRPRRVETHVPGFAGMVYGRRVRLHFLAKIRDEIKFASAEDLVAQIHRDIAFLGI